MDSNKMYTLKEAANIAMVNALVSLHGEEVLVPYISSKPGAGKSQLLYQLCTDKGFNFLPITVGLMRPERFSGIPDFRQEGDSLNTVWSVPEIVSTIRRLADDKPTIVLFDDWHQADSDIQACGFELFTYWSINGYNLPRDRVAFILAGNDSSAAGNRLSFSAVMNRVAKYECYPNFDDWKTDFADPRGVASIIISFLDNASYRHLFHDQEDTRDPWASPRSWTGLSGLYKNLKESSSDLFSNTKNTSFLFNLVAAHVGKEAATDFVLYHDIYSKIDAHTIFQTGQFDYPEDRIKQYAFCYAITDEFYNLYMKGLCDQNVMNTYKNIINTLRNSSPDLVVRTMRTINNRSTKLLMKLISTKNFTPAELNAITSATSILARG